MLYDKSIDGSNAQVACMGLVVAAMFAPIEEGVCIVHVHKQGSRPANRNKKMAGVI